MVLSIASTVLLGGLAFWWGVRLGRWLLRQGATARDLFRGRNWISIAFLGLYIAMLFLVLHAPQWHWLPMEWRVQGMHVTWTAMRVMLLGICGVGLVVCWYTLRRQVVLVAIIGLLGMSSFTTAEHYLLAPIHHTLTDQLLPNGVYRQSSNSSCAAAAMATVLRTWDRDVPESRVAELAETSRLGTSMPQLIVAARALGLDGLEVKDATWEQIQQIDRPGVLASWLIDDLGRRTPHAIALLGIDDNAALIADPALGKLFSLTPTQLQRIWRREYVPFFQPESALLSQVETRNYLEDLGYLPSASANLTNALKHFQADFQVKPTGKITPLTALLLSGQFFDDAPRLSDGRSQPPRMSSESRS